MKFTVQIECENINTLKFYLSKLVLQKKCEIISITDEEKHTEEFAEPNDILRPDRSEAFIAIKNKRADNVRLKIEAMTETELNKIAKGLGVKTAKLKAIKTKSALIEEIKPLIKL